MKLIVLLNVFRLLLALLIILLRTIKQFPLTLSYHVLKVPRPHLPWCIQNFMFLPSSKTRKKKDNSITYTLANCCKRWDHETELSFLLSMLV